MSDVVTGLIVTRWKRYGKDRLYVSGADGAKVGWWDLVTDEAHPESPQHASALETAIAGWRAARLLADVSDPVRSAEPTQPAPTAPEELEVAVPAAAPEPAPEPEPEPEPAIELAPALVIAAAGVEAEERPARPWIDLATNRPGAEAREQALAAREAAPVKTFLARALGVHTDERAWRIGADGEEKVGAQLAKAAKKDPRWRFLHAIPVGERGSDIDHLVIGPGGIFTVNAKHHPGAKIWVGGSTFLVNGNRQPYIRNSRHEANRAAKLLTATTGFPVHVEGLIVTVNADDVTIKNAPDGVSVVPRMQLARWLVRHGDILDDDALDAIFDAARRSTTWRP